MSNGVVYVKLKHFHLVGPNWPPSGHRISMGGLGPSRARNQLTEMALAKVHQILEKRFNWVLTRLKVVTGIKLIYPIKWGALAASTIPKTLDYLIEKSKFKYYEFSGPKTWLQYADKSNMDKCNNEISLLRTELLYLANAWYSEQFKQLTKEGVLKSCSGISNLLKQSLTHCSYWTDIL